MIASVYDFDPSWDAPDGVDDLGQYVTREVDFIKYGIAWLKNGIQSHTYKIIPEPPKEEQIETLTENEFELLIALADFATSVFY